jgi:transposase
MSIKRYDRNFKIEVVRRVKVQGQKVSTLAKELGIHENTIYKWIGEINKDEVNAFPGSGYLKPEDAEIRRLKKENSTLKEENEILKKAAAFFAKNLK